MDKLEQEAWLALHAKLEQEIKEKILNKDGFEDWHTMFYGTIQQLLSHIDSIEPLRTRLNEVRAKLNRSRL